ncbi:UNVERIFIED_ORG: hypothetical protein E4P37_07060 [Bacillus sp. AZ43]
MTVWEWGASVVALGVTVMASLKLLATVMAIRWAGRHAAAYSTAFAERRPDDLRSGIALLHEFGSWFFPFGIKDYWLREHKERCATDGVFRRELRRCGRGFASVFRAKWLVLGSTVVCVAVGLTLDGGQWPVVVLSSVAALLSTALVVESLLWYIAAGGYAEPFHLVHVAKGSRPGAGDRTNEATTFLRLGVFAGVTSIVAVWTLHRQYGGFGAVDAGQGVGAELGRLGEFAYFVLSNLSTTGGSVVQPESGWANALGSLIHVQTLLIVTFALAIFVNLFRGAGREEPAARGAVPAPRGAADDAVEFVDAR